MKRPLKEIIGKLTEQVQKKEMIIVAGEGYRYYTDALTQSIVIPITDTNSVAELYEKLVLDAATNITLPGAVADPHAELPRVSMFVGQPDTGKTYKAIEIAKTCGIEPLIKMCRDNLNLETLLEDFTLVDGKPVFQESVALKMMSDTAGGKYLIVFDEFNTLLTGVMKTLQPIFDDTSTTFEYRGKIYHKNMNCKFIVTLNDKDKGISIVPDAILSRSRLTWFEPVDLSRIAAWTNTPLPWVTNLFSIYKALGMLNIFGTRQVKMLKGATDVAQIKNHLYGLCMMRSIPGNALDTIEIQNFITKLI